jgi:AraC family transcriptional regulator
MAIKRMAAIRATSTLLRGPRMRTVGKAIWYIESHFGEVVTLGDVATAVGLSRFHLSRTFAEATGCSLTAYLRGRRLSEAARALAAGAPDILTVALEACYGSHEAFSGAFRDQFGVTPEEVRARRSLDALTLLEPLPVPTMPPAAITPPTTRALPQLWIAGMRRYFAFADCGGIPTLWQRFVPHLGHIPGEIAGAAYGVCMPPTDGWR